MENFITKEEPLGKRRDPRYENVRDWCYTIHNYDDDLSGCRVENREPKSVYQVYGYEVCPTTGARHIQGYIYFEQAKSLSAVKKQFQCKAMHLENAHGDAESNRAYCTKEGDFREIGTKPSQGKRNDILAIKELVKSGKGMKDIINVATNYQCLKIGECLLKYLEEPRRWKTKTIWVWGSSGTGKTFLAETKLKEMYGTDPYIKNERTGKWWDAYDAHEGVILDEIDHNSCYSTLKELCDRYPCKVENKGGMRQFLAKTIYITSLRCPKDLFRNKAQEGKEMIRRIDEIIFLADSISDDKENHEDDDFSKDDEEIYEETEEDLC